MSDICTTLNILRVQSWAQNELFNPSHPHWGLFEELCVALECSQYRTIILYHLLRSNPELTVVDLLDTLDREATRVKSDDLGLSMSYRTLHMKIKMLLRTEVTSRNYPGHKQNVFLYQWGGKAFDECLS